MITPLRVGAVLAALAMTALLAPTAAAVTDLELATRWAPIHYQDTDSSDYDADYVTAVDYDGEWDTLNNWEHQDDSLARLTGTAYYSVVETSTHWFIGYSFYHPRDWEDFPDPFRQFTHENDLEGTVLTVRRDGSQHGRLEAMVTVAHSDFYSYVPSGSTFTSGRENVDGALILRDGRPTTRQEAKGHGLYAWNGAEFPGGDGVVYYPGTAEVPSSGNDRSVGYRLVSVFSEGGMWARRHSAATFASYGTFRGDNGKPNSANAPWGWDDGNDGSDIPRGMLATDPAYLVAQYFAGEGTFSQVYTRNEFQV
ncbi:MULTISPECIES: hypothetical protein [Actinokineospora]|uniref:Uncharacterized protein n=1 Tax=Actinokineospora fastidiosa TaxID=1816 RepID=A0A918GHX5_9PSEU|nr:MULTISPECIES: hypothetical protein [Actinokineospora]UVS80969.1 hypothetical protein Actkin_04721 [Actinokineospora sp. UTMC 2448]GGS38611.1 hypothetical protein GCM10010171_36920 [Actinokineospora fastidiosa]